VKEQDKGRFDQINKLNMLMDKQDQGKVLSDDEKEL